jgi:hypothetical protein
MKSVQLPTAISIVALALSLISVGVQVRRDTQGPVTPAIGSVAGDVDGAKDSKSEPQTPEINAAVLATADLEARLTDTSTQLTEKVARLERELEGVTRLMRASGLDTAVPLWGGGPGAPGPLFEQLGKEAASRAQFEARRQELSRRAAESRDKDYTRYGAERYSELEELFKAARPGRGQDTEEGKTKRTDALNKLVEEFPEAYSTGVAVAEQALNEALDGNTGQVESYLQTLKESAQYGDIVTDQGVDALPNIQAFLARQYIDQNRVDEASSLLEDLSQNHSDSLIIEPTNGGPPKPPRTVREVVDELRQQLQTSN